MDSIETGGGILKNFYDTAPVAAALKKKREKLAETKGIGEQAKEDSKEE